MSEFNEQLRAAVAAEEKNQRDDEGRERFRIEARANAHKALDQWFDDVERERPDLSMGEQGSIRFSGGYGDGYMTLTCKRSIEKEFA